MLLTCLHVGKNGYFHTEVVFMLTYDGFIVAIFKELINKYIKILKPNITNVHSYNSHKQKFLGSQ